MDAISGINAAKQSIANNNGNASLQALDTDAFLKLMIVQLQNQDPLDPTDNNELLQQVNEIRNIGATDKMTQTLNAVLLGQNLASATSMIGAAIDGADDEGNYVAGVVDFVSIESGVPKLHVAGTIVSLNNVTNIAPYSAE